MKRHIAIYHTWPELKNAEYENVLRIIDAAKRINLNITLIDNRGYVVSSTIPELSNTKNRLSHGDCDFAISLHFESPKVLDLYSYYALWNPLEFYHSWGYDKTIRQFMTHDDLLSCDSDAADAHALNLYSAVSRAPPLDLPRMHHSLSSEVIAPNVGAKSRAFYIGINWERINSTRGRHHDLLVALDKAGMIDIYGPELFHGVKPWEGFASYRGSVPFDGRSTIRRIADSGICLAFSSAAHQSSGIMSNRLFEGLAGGALIIANTHPFIEKFFKDLIPVVDDSKPPKEVIADVKRIVEWARANPAEANAKAAAAQKIFLERFSLEQSLTRLLDGHAQRVAARRTPAGDAVSVTAILVDIDASVARFAAVIDELAAQTHKPQALKVIVDEAWAQAHKSKLDDIVKAKLGVACEFVTAALFDALASGRTPGRLAPMGPAVGKAIRSIDTDAFLLVRPGATLFSNHLETLCETLARNPDALAAQSGVLIESKSEKDQFSRRIEYVSPPPEANIFANQVRYEGASLYRTRLRDHLQDHTFVLLDGQEHNYLNIAAFMQSEAVPTFATTYCFREWEETAAPELVWPVEQQHQYARDALRGAAARRPELFRTPHTAPPPPPPPSVFEEDWRKFKRLLGRTTRKLGLRR